MFKDVQELIHYIVENYPEITDLRIDADHYNVLCDTCKVVRGFLVVDEYAHTISGKLYGSYRINVIFPQTIVLKCPVCKSFKMWLIYTVTHERKVKGGLKEVNKFYKILTIPDEGLEEIEELPDEFPALKIAFKQALRAQNANAYLAAAAMYRRALQVITRLVLKVKPGNLAVELKDIVGLEYDGIKITKNFQDVAYIVKEAGNQGAHPDQDPDLLDFTEEDAKDLGRILIELTTDLFVVPKAIKEAKENFKTRRKIN